MKLSETTIETRNAFLRVTESGSSGMPMLLLHGSGSSRRIFDRQLVSSLSGRFRMIVPDLPGHGDSSDALDAGLRSYTLTGLAETIGTLIDRLGLDQVVVVGWSLGGHIALELLGSHRAVAGAMVMGAPPIGRGPLALLRAFRVNSETLLASRRKFSESQALRFAKLCFDNAPEPSELASIRRADGRLRKVMFGSMLRGQCADEKDIVGTAEVSLAIVNGANDPFVKTDYVTKLRYRNLWEGMCHVIPEAGHDAFRRHADVFNPMLTRFADEVASRSARSQSDMHQHWQKSSRGG